MAGPKLYGPWCQCGHHTTDHRVGDGKCNHCPCPGYKLAGPNRRSGRWDEMDGDA